MAEEADSIATRADDDRPGPAARFRLWLRSFLPFAIILILDPFGCSQVADRYSEQILLRLAAPFHRGDDAGRGYAATPGQAKVTVILLDQAWIDEITIAPPGTWPPPRSDQIAQMLHPILEQGPEAVLLDYTFSGERPSPATPPPDALDLEAPDAVRQQLENEIKEHEGAAPDRRSPRLFLGSKPLFPSTARGCPVPRVPLQHVANAGDVAASLRHWPRSVKGSEKGSEVEIVTLRRYDRTHYPVLPYQVSGDDGCGVVVGGPRHAYLASPAYALFVTWCERESSGRGAKLCEGAARRPVPGGPNSPSYYLYRGSDALAGSMAPVWPGFRSPAQQATDKRLIDAGAPLLATRINQCESRGRMRDVSLAASLLWSRLWRADAGDARAIEPCRYGVDVMTMSALHALTAAGGKPLHGRYVLVGLDVPNVHDVIDSPLFGDVPGVLLHAVALENLISWGPDILSDRPANAWASGLVITFVIGVMLSLLSVAPGTRRAAAAAVTWLRTRRARGGRALATPLIAVGAVLVMMAVPLAIGVLLSWWVRLAPLNWVSLIPAMLWVLELMLETNEQALADREAAARLPDGNWPNRLWLRRFLLPAALVVLVFALLIGTQE